jgi:hypothetical protein
MLSLSACEVTNFEKPPIAESTCDANLAGHWDSVGDKPDENGDVQLDVSPTCLLEVSDRKDGAMRHGAPTQLHVGQFGTWHYAWVDSTWAQKRFDSELPTNDGDIHLLRYKVDHDDLVMNAMDDTAIAHRIIDDKIDGVVHKDDKGLQNRITGGPHPELLDSMGFFKEEALSFHRGASPAKP